MLLIVIILFYSRLNFKLIITSKSIPVLHHWYLYIYIYIGTIRYNIDDKHLFDITFYSGCLVMMDVPYGFDCYAFKKDEIKYFESNIYREKYSFVSPAKTLSEMNGASQDYVRFTRKNEDYPKEQITALTAAGRLSTRTGAEKIFCGIKVQIGIGVVTNFLQKGLQYKMPIKGRAEMINGSWTGVVKGLTADYNSPISYDIAFGNFLAWDQEFPYIKFGPFFAIESKLVMLTGSSRRIEASSFGTNMTTEIWLTILSLLVLLSLLSSLRIHWQYTKYKSIEDVINQVIGARMDQSRSLEVTQLEPISDGPQHREKRENVVTMIQDFFFIYFTMLLNKPSVEFDDLIWPKNAHRRRPKFEKIFRHRNLQKILDSDQNLRRHYERMLKRRKKRYRLPTSIRILSYMWSAACLVMASIYSGEMLAVMLLHTDQNIDTIAQLVNSKPPIEPVIRQDDHTYTLMVKSLDENMIKLYNKTKLIPRTEVYSQDFIEKVSERKLALLGDDELVETIYDIYHKYYPLYKSKISYLQYPISIMYRKDFNSTLENKLRRGIVQIFEMGLIHRWYQAQKETYMKFYDINERKNQDKGANVRTLASRSDQKYKPLSMHHFRSFFKAIIYCILFAFVVLILEFVHNKIVAN